MMAILSIGISVPSAAQTLGTQGVDFRRTCAKSPPTRLCRAAHEEASGALTFVKRAPNGRRRGFAPGNECRARCYLQPAICRERLRRWAAGLALAAVPRAISSRCGL